MVSLRSRFSSGGFFNSAANAGPRRFVILASGIAGVAVVVTAVTLSGTSAPPKSSPGRMARVDALPGGTNSDPQQEKLGREADQENADRASRRGKSYTPPLAGSVPVSEVPYSLPPPTAPAASAVGFEHQPPPRPTKAAPQVHFVSDRYANAVAPTATADPDKAKLYNDAVNRILHGLNARPPQTDVEIDPDLKGVTGSADPATSGADATTKDVSYATRSASSTADHILLPAGRGVFAHTVLAADSDSPGPVILQADSGPLAGDRMIGSFSKAGGQGSGTDRLIVRVESIEHQGKSISVDGLVTAPDTMETTVASSVDEHYASRFLLPAAAAFVEGLGVALATTSNTITTNSVLGGSTAATSLSLPQQLGVAAGTAAQTIGNTLAAQAPKGPTVHLDANSNVGVMFLTAVTESGTN